MNEQELLDKLAVQVEDINQTFKDVLAAGLKVNTTCSPLREGRDIPEELLPHTLVVEVTRVESLLNTRCRLTDRG